MLVNANRSDHGVSGDAEQRNRHNGYSDIVGRIAIVAVEQSLFNAKHLPAQRRRAVFLPGFGGKLDLIGAGQKRLEWFEHHARILFS